MHPATQISELVDASLLSTNPYLLFTYGSVAYYFGLG
jgi:hypothetical protein